MLRSEQRGHATFSTSTLKPYPEHSEGLGGSGSPLCLLVQLLESLLDELISITLDIQVEIDRL